MSQRALTLPLRRRVLRPAWVCRRCLATESETPSPASVAVTPPSPPPPARRTELPLAVQSPPLNTPPDPFLRKRLPHRIPTQYLQHSTSEELNRAERAERDNHIEKHHEIRGVVVSAGLMDKTVRVRVPGRRWNKKIGKFYASYTQHLVHDPNNSLIVGDVIQLHRLKVSSQVFHVVGAITAPFGKPISERPPVPTPDERLSKYKQQRFAKLERRELRRKAAMGNGDAIRELKSRGLDPGRGTEEGAGEKANVEQGVGKKRTPTKGAILGKIGQKLPHGVLPGGKHEVGKIDERAKHNKESAMKMDRQAEANLLEAKEKGDALHHEQGLSAGEVLPKKSSVGEQQ